MTETGLEERCSINCDNIWRHGKDLIKVVDCPDFSNVQNNSIYIETSQQTDHLCQKNCKTWPERKTVKINTALASWQLHFVESECDGMQTRNLLAYFSRKAAVLHTFNFMENLKCHFRFRRLNTTTVKENEILDKNKKKAYSLPPKNVNGLKKQLLALRLFSKLYNPKETQGHLRVQASSAGIACFVQNLSSSKSQERRSHQ